MSLGFLSTPAWLSSTAALGASFTWAVTSLLFARAAKTLGALRVNLYRLVLATIIAMIAHWLLEGSLLPTHLSGATMLYFALSGIVGLALGDLFYFHAIAVLGPRKGSLLAATAPIQAGMLAFLFLGEQLPFLAWLGILANFLGVFLVLADRSTIGAWDAKIPPAAKKLAIAAGLLGGFGQALGLVFAKEGLELAKVEGGNALDAHTFRMLAAVIPVVLWTFYTHKRRKPRAVDLAKKKQAITLLYIGAFLGPSLGVWLSLVALQQQATGVAAALLSLAPIMVIPMVRIVHGERIGRFGILGTLVATLGTLLLILG